MIDCKELRIGNWIFEIHNKEFVQVQWAHPCEIVVRFKNDIIEADHIHGELTDFIPIPLDAELLEKCGFYWSIYHQAFHYGDGALNEFYDLIECYPSGFQLSTFKRVQLIGQPIQYLHQLQNVFYFLSNQELIINLKTTI